VEDFINSFINSFNKTFIIEGRYKLFVSGIKNTIFIAFFATLIGIIIGLFIAIVKTNAKNNKKFFILDKLCSFYVAIIRGTPVVVQLLIMYYTIFVNIDNSILVAILTFGFNSGAYV